MPLKLLATKEKDMIPINLMGFILLVIWFLKTPRDRVLKEIAMTESEQL